MASDIFDKMIKTALTRLGGSVLLNGVSGYQAEISHGVEVAIASNDGDVISHKTVVNIRYTDSVKPKNGDVVTINSHDYKLDFLLKDDGYSARWVVI